MRLACLLLVPISLSASLAAAQAAPQPAEHPQLHVEVMQAEGGRNVGEGLAALATLRTSLEACRPSAERAYPYARVVARVSLSEAGTVDAVELRDADSHPTAPEWHACATAALRSWHLPRGARGSLTITANWQTPVDQLREMV